MKIPLTLFNLSYTFIIKALALLCIFITQIQFSMKYVIAIFQLALSTICLSQKKYEEPGSIRIDSAIYERLCIDRGITEFYSLNAKHPKSSYQILDEARQFYKKPEKSAQSGFLTVRLIVNCRGEAVAFQLYEIDENYKNRPFDALISSQLLDFVKKLGGWKIGTYEGKSYNYYTYLSFKIKNGNLETVAP
jgi:hypothetical protein